MHLASLMKREIQTPHSPKISVKFIDFDEHGVRTEDLFEADLTLHRDKVCGQTTYIWAQSMLVYRIQGYHYS